MNKRKTTPIKVVDTEGIIQNYFKLDTEARREKIRENTLGANIKKRFSGNLLLSADIGEYDCPRRHPLASLS